MSITNTFSYIIKHPLNRRRKFGALWRYLRWQIGSRLVPGEVLYRWFENAYFIVRPGETGLTGNIYTGLHEFPDMGFLLHYLGPDDLFVDIGANVGSYTILACAVVGADGIAFEPVPSTFTRLINNIRINNLGAKVNCMNCAVGATVGVMACSQDEDTMNHVLGPGESKERQFNVEVTTLDSALCGLHPSLMKIDVEGFETAVLAGGEKVLQGSKLNAVIMELNGSGGRYGFDEEDLLKVMLNAGFRTYSYDPLLRKLISLEGKNARSGNTLFIKNLFDVEHRLKTAPRRFINGANI